MTEKLVILFMSSLCGSHYGMMLMRKYNGERGFIKIILMAQQSKKIHQKLLLPGLSTFNIPSISQFPNAIGDSLKFITTERNIDFVSRDYLDQYHTQKDDQHESEQEDSLALRLQKPEPATSSGKKKRIGCTCKKTFCLKMYCECFANSKTCNQDCVCCECKNIEQNKEIIQQAKQNVKEKGIHSCSLSQKRCNCKKSFCQKKYCQCFNAGISCSDACKCTECYNREFVQDDKKPPEGEVQKKAIQGSQSFLQKSVANLQHL